MADHDPKTSRFFEDISHEFRLLKLEIALALGSDELDMPQIIQMALGLVPLLLWIVIVACLLCPWGTASPKPSALPPAQNLVSYEMQTSTPYFHNRSPDVGNDTQKVNKMWEDLYDAGLISVISSDEASKLLNKGLAALEAPDFYLVQLQVFRDLHCLNLIRQWVYMDVYPDMAEWSDGKINHDSSNALRVDRCIDDLRHSIMCTSDITPRKFAPYPDERQDCVCPEIHTTQMGGNFGAIKKWAKERRAVGWTMSFDDEWRWTRFNREIPDPNIV